MTRRTLTIHRKTSLAVFAGSMLLLAGCGSLTPTPYTKDEIKDRVLSDRQKMFAEQEPVSGPITFHEAAARALKYNLDYRLKLMESALSRSLYDVSKFDMLPRLVANAGYAGRSNTAGGYSEGINLATGRPDGVVTLVPSTATEDNRRLAGLTLSWNVLDFGVSYYRAQQKADQILMAEERRRKVVQNVLQDVRNAYWRAVGAQRLIGDVNSLIDRTYKALEAARKAEDQGLLPRLQALSYQRALLDAVSLMNLRRQDLELARAELAALMSLPPGTPMVLADTEEPIVSTLPNDTETLERMALERRPEIMEEWYRKRVTATDIKIAKAQVWPNLSLEAGPLYDSNKYLYNNNWAEAGLRLSLNLIKLLQWPALDQAQVDQEQTDDTRRMGLSMAVLTQVHVGKQRYELSLSELKFAEEIMRVDGRLLEYAKAAASTSVDSELEVIRAEARWLLARYQRQAAYSNAQAAWGRFYNSVGLDVMPEAIESHDVKTLATEIKRTIGEWESVGLRAPEAPAKSKAPG